MAQIEALQLQDMEQNNKSRFQVDAVDGDREDEVYDSRQSRKSYGQLTREVPPRVEHYRDFSSSANYRPTLEELHEGKKAHHDKSHPEGEDGEQDQKKGKVIKFGWLEGVFMRCLLNIWGVMLFLRLSWVIGQAGIAEGVAIILLANVVTTITTISMSAVSTNGQIKGGGIYYMISRSLGPEFGGAIGLMFTVANSVAVAMYIVGFCESLLDAISPSGIFEDELNDIRLIGSVTLVGILILAIIGMDWVTRFQMILLLVLVLSQVDFVIGAIMGPKEDEEIAQGFVGFSSETFKQNAWNDYRYFEGTDHSFFSVFAVFFPAVTGIVAGANLSGDLKDPSEAIPKGTILAIAVTCFSYLVYAFMMAASVVRQASGQVEDYHRASADNSTSLYEHLSSCGNNCTFGLHNDNQVMKLVSWFSPLIYGGCFAATLSSAIASLVGAPRVLQALAKDKIYPKIEWLSVGWGANNDPVRGYFIVFIFSFGCILIGQLNDIAPLLSNFFLAAYALINFSVFHASISKSPGWRPAFKFYNAWVSLLGTLLCITVMFLMSWYMALITFGVVVALYLYVAYRKPEVNWGSSTQAHAYNSALKSMQELNHVEEHVKNYRPQLLVLSGMPGTRPPLIDFAYLITKSQSLLICGNIIQGKHSQSSHDALGKKAFEWLSRHKIKAFVNIAEGNLETGAQSLIYMAGLGKLKPNMLLMGYKGNWQTCDRDELKQYFNTIHTALDRYLAVGILRVQDGLDFSSYLLNDEFAVPLNTLDKKDAEEKMRRNVSTCQFPQDCVILDTVPPMLAYKSDLMVSNDPDVVENQSEPIEINISVPSPKTDNKPIPKPKKSKVKEELFVGPTGEPLPENILEKITQFRRKQNKGFIDVWWLYDDGGLTLLIPYILSTRSQFSSCKLRIFSLATSKNELDREQRNLAALLSKFRIDYSDVIVISDINRKAEEETQKEFETFIEKFREQSVYGESKEKCITDSELVALKEKTNRHMRLREMLLQHSVNSTFVVMALPIPRKGIVSAPLYMAWLELLTRGMPPYLIVRGNQQSVLTFYS